MNENIFQKLQKTAVPTVLSVPLAEEPVNTGLLAWGVLKKHENSQPFPTVLTVPERLLGTDGTEAENTRFNQPFFKELNNHAGLQADGTEERLERLKNYDAEKDKRAEKETELRKLVKTVSDNWGGDEAEYLAEFIADSLSPGKLDEALVCFRNLIDTRPPFKLNKPLPIENL